MSNNRHTAALDAERKSALAKQVRIVYPDSIVVNGYGELMTYAVYTNPHTGKRDPRESALFILNPDALDPENIRAEIASKQQRHRFVRYFAPLFSNTDMGAIYDQMLKEFWQEHTVEEIAPLAKTLLAQEYQTYPPLRAAYEELSALGKTAHKKGEHLRAEMDGLHEKVQELYTVSSPIEPLTHSQRKRIETHIHKRLSELPQSMLEYCARDNVCVSLMPLQNTFTYSFPNLSWNDGQMEAREHAICVQGDTALRVLREEATHLMDYHTGFSASERFEKAMQADGKANIQRFDQLAQIACSNFILARSKDTEGAWNQRLHDMKAALYADSDSPFRSSSTTDQSYETAYDGANDLLCMELLANIQHVRHMGVLSEGQIHQLDKIGIRFGMDAKQNQQMLQDFINDTIPHLWAVYTGLDGGKSFESTLQEQLSTLRPPQTTATQRSV